MKTPLASHIHISTSQIVNDQFTVIIGFISTWAATALQHSEMHENVNTNKRAFTTFHYLLASPHFSQVIQLF